MTGFAVAAPKSLVIHHVNPVDGWTGVADGASARWTGGSLPAKQTARFTMLVKADVEPGLVQLEAKQLYDDGNVVSWPVELTVVPAAESPRQNLARAGVVGLIGVLVVGVIGMLVWRRNARTLQER
jgi:hypothetical protein